MANNNSITLKDKAHGRWSEIFGHFLNDSKINAALAKAGKHVPSPINPDSKKNGFRFAQDFESRNGLSFDNSRLGGMSGVQLISEITGKSITDVSREMHQYLDGNTNNQTQGKIKQRVANNQHDQKIADEQKLKFAQKTTDAILKQETNRSVIEDYLTSRGLSEAFKNINDDIIGIDKLRLDSKNNLPAMVAQVKDNDDNLLFLHRTYLNQDHQKNTSLESSKKVTSKIRSDAYTKEHHIQVNNAKKTDTVHIAEGIETGLVVSMLTKNNAPVYSTINTGGMAKFNPKDGVKNVVIWADNDVNSAGMNAANKLKDRLSKQGINIDIHLPKTQGHDFLDAFNTKELDYQVINEVTTSNKDIGAKKTVQKTVDDLIKMIEKDGYRNNPLSPNFYEKDGYICEITNQSTVRFGSNIKLVNFGGKQEINRFASISLDDGIPVKDIYKMINEMPLKTQTKAKENKSINIPKPQVQSLKESGKSGDNKLKTEPTPKVKEEIKDQFLAQSNSSLLTKFKLKIITNKATPIFIVKLVNKYLDEPARHSALIIAINNKNLKTFKVLSFSHNLNLKDSNGNALINHAADKDNVQILNYLINQGANLENKDNNGNTALMSAVVNNHTTASKILINNQVNINTTNLDKESAITLAVKHNNPSAVKSLMQAGADPLLQAKNNAIILAARKSKEMLSIFSEQSKIDAQNKQGETPLMMAINHQESQQTIKRLFNNMSAVGIDLQDNNGNTALINAIKVGDKASTNHLIKISNVNLQDNNGNTALMSAVNNQDLKSIDKLITASADLNLQDNNGDTALIKAVQASNQTTKHIIKAGADINQTDHTGDTALIAAARDNNIKAMITLIRAGADTTITNNRNLSAAEIAKPFSATYLTLKAHSIVKQAIKGLRMSTKIPKIQIPPQTKLQKLQEKQRVNTNEQTRH